MQGGRRLTQQSQGASTHEPEAGRREARAQRILDAASTLILRYGYHKTTIDDIARQAGVGKGTLYLHWNTREALFAALILREKVAMAEDIKQRIACDPAGATLRGLLKHAALAEQRSLCRGACRLHYLPSRTARTGPGAGGSLSASASSSLQFHFYRIFPRCAPLARCF